MHLTNVPSDKISQWIRRCTDFFPNNVSCCFILYWFIVRWTWTESISRRSIALKGPGQKEHRWHRKEVGGGSNKEMGHAYDTVAWHLPSCVFMILCNITTLIRYTTPGASYCLQQKCPVLLWHVSPCRLHGHLQLGHILACCCSGCGGHVLPDAAVQGVQVRGWKPLVLWLESLGTQLGPQVLLDSLADMGRSPILGPDDGLDTTFIYTHFRGFK